MADLQELFDGNTYQLAEVAATPGMDLIVDFVTVNKFNYVQILANYDGGSTHSISIQLWDWDTSQWLTWDSMSGIEKTIVNHGFYVPCGANYIGTGGDVGKVRVRLVHTQAGNNAHDAYIGVVALYDRDFRLDRHWGLWR